MGRFSSVDLDQCNDGADSKAFHRADCVFMLEGLSSERGFCDRLAKLSHDALEGKKTETPAGACNDLSEIENRAQALREQFTQPQLRAKFSDVIENHACASCHISGGGVGAPQLPMNSVASFEKSIKSSAEPGSLAYMVWDRVSRHFDQYGAMPKGGEPLGIDEKATVRAYLQGLTSFPRQPICSGPAEPGQNTAPGVR